MSSRPATRQDLYDQIRQSSRDEVILNEMIRLGFWKKNSTTKLPEDIIRKKGEISKRLRELAKHQRLYMDRDQALAEIHRIRKEESLKRRKELKEERERKAIAKKKAWQEKKSKEILFLGKGYSYQLSKFEGDQEKLAKYSLNHFESHLSLAEAMGISLRELKFLTFAREVSSSSHYKRFTIPKKTGGERLISAPQDRLKNQQYWIYENILKKLPMHQAAHGFTTGKSIVSNAEPHLGSKLVINLDLKDFFPSLSYKRVLGMFIGMGYSPAIATVLALLTTEQPTQEVELDGERWFVASGTRCLPQGAPTSPAITNWICRRLDVRLEGVAKKFGFSYTRYADDMTFSANEEGVNNSQKLLWQVKKIVHEEGFTIHPNKLRLMRKGQRQEVTGVVVNEKPSVSRKKVKAYRALLHHLNSKGLEGATWDGSVDNLIARALGYARFLVMVDPTRFINSLKQMESFAASQGYQPEIRYPRKPDSEKAQPVGDYVEDLDPAIDLEEESSAIVTDKEVSFKKTNLTQIKSGRGNNEAKPQGLLKKLWKAFFG